ncbi:apolipoprotein N-acyltransferase [Pedobacter faecalis]|uniref:apolipoprotein N-acyltransferase n=1 Tax=Pedobacter faecalis TaxID=3041495 RepID=UPI002550F466|nr:apolipoprotein N-acyltransferase [Pedobacter sp. ELA7]
MIRLFNKPLFLALLSALLLWLAWPPIPYAAPLLLVALVPLLIAISVIEERAGVKRGKRIFLTAGLTFLIWNTASIYWIYNAISAYNDPFTAFLISLIPYGLGAALMTFAFWLYHRFKRNTNRYIGYLGLVSFYIAMEYLHQVWELAFPWMTLGNGFSGMVEMVQWYEYTGVYGGSLWVLLSNIAVFEIYRSFSKSNSTGYRLKSALVWVLIAGLPIAYSLYRYHTYAEEKVPVNVVVVQPNIDPYSKYGSLSVNSQLDILTGLSDSVGQVNTEYFIWPETAVPNYADEERIRENNQYEEIQEFLAKYKNGTVITGIETVKRYPDKATITAKNTGRGDFYDNFNAAMQVENSPNVQFYHKSKLVPGVEKMPFPALGALLAPVFEGLGGTVGGWGWQENPGVFFAHSGIGAAPVICYESLWGAWISRAVKDGAQFIAIITNDGWWGNTSGKDQHLLYAKLRAVETRRYVVRSANTGISAFINQRGDIIKQSDWWTKTALKADINLNDEQTFYVRNGDIIPVASSGISVVLALLMIAGRFRKKLR